MNTYAQHYADGVLSEEQCHQPIEQFLQRPLKRSASRYSTFDYENNETLVELKTRRMTRHDLWATVFITSHKWHAGVASEKDVYFFFRYADGLFVYKQEKDANFNRKMVGNVNRDRYTKKNECIEIPTDRLTYVCNVPPASNLVTFD